MSHIRHLDFDEDRNLNQWLEEQCIDLNSKKRRELSDVLPVAIIVKKFYTRLVDLNPYTPLRNSVALKLKNWEIFNARVLKKLNIKLSDSDIMALAQGSRGAIESLFYDLFLADRSIKTPRESRTPDESVKILRKTPKGHSMSLKQRKEALQKRIESLERRNELLQNSSEPLDSKSLTFIETPGAASVQDLSLKSRSLTFNSISRPAPVLALSEMLIVDAGQTINGTMLEMPYHVVPYDIYEKDMRASVAKDAYISRLEEKTKYMKDIINLKDSRIDDLMSQLCKLSVKLLQMNSSFKKNLDKAKKMQDFANS
ncbi:sperm flagellar protein 1-like [Drosophila pseudoobscura]|uniref:Sperm flagellar protein 1-like n=1 Tax=Drosophila pseudoobscura pseudoobscura TaxID=46245 RepID=A0A6I8UC11_DROPS|nr:sperm flagellar protein 1 [Drosophila pseudoobscura]